MTETLLVSVREAARELGIGRDSAYQLVREGRLRAVHVSERRVLIARAELQQFVERDVDDAFRGFGVSDAKRLVDVVHNVVLEAISEGSIAPGVAADLARQIADVAAFRGIPLDDLDALLELAERR